MERLFWFKKGLAGERELCLVHRGGEIGREQEMLQGSTLPWGAVMCGGQRDAVGRSVLCVHEGTSGSQQEEQSTHPQHPLPTEGDV